MLQSFHSIPGGARTRDPLIKSQLLYQLSYGNFFMPAKVNKRLIFFAISTIKNVIFLFL